MRAQWTDSKWYLAEIMELKPEKQYRVRFEDGVSTTVFRNQIDVNTAAPPGAVPTDSPSRKRERQPEQPPADGTPCNALLALPCLSEH